jgi:hypothetical protein
MRATGRFCAIPASAGAIGISLQPRVCTAFPSESAPDWIEGENSIKSFFVVRAMAHGAMLTIREDIPAGRLEVSARDLHCVLPGATLIHLPGR